MSMENKKIVNIGPDANDVYVNGSDSDLEDVIAGKKEQKIVSNSVSNSVAASESDSDSSDDEDDTDDKDNKDNKDIKDIKDNKDSQKHKKKDKHHHKKDKKDRKDNKDKEDSKSPTTKHKESNKEALEDTSSEDESSESSSSDDSDEESASDSASDSGSNGTMSSLNTVDILKVDPLYFRLTKFLQTSESSNSQPQNVADILFKINQNLETMNTNISNFIKKESESKK